MRPLAAVLLCLAPGLAQTAEPRCQIVPLANHEVSLKIDGEEKTRWHFGPKYPRPFFHPYAAPAGGSLTRVGHPGAPNHDHHRSIWFAHDKVDGEDFWSENGGTRIRQVRWLVYEDGEDKARMAVELVWKDREGKTLIRQILVAEFRPLEDGAFSLELQSTFKGEGVVLGKSNLGVLGVRVAAPVSAHFGNGRLLDAEGRKGELAIFGKAARWVDYAGTLRSGPAGITCYSHPSNLGGVPKWHVRADGWMGPSLCRDRDVVLKPGKPLRLRYLLHAHRGLAPGPESVGAWEKRPFLEVLPCKRPHRQFELVPLSEGEGAGESER